MTLAEFLTVSLNTIIYQSIAKQRDNKDKKLLDEIFHSLFIQFIPITCKDGFRISIQFNSYVYCESENGFREYGDKLLTAEWGFPSQSIDYEKYNGDNAPDVSNIGCCSIELLQELLDEHGGIDLSKMSLYQYIK